jgi:hypothetical protein
LRTIGSSRTIVPHRLQPRPHARWRGFLISQPADRSKKLRRRCEQPEPVTVTLDDQPETVLLDLVYPIGVTRNFCSPSGNAGGERISQHGREIVTVWPHCKSRV